MNLILLGAPGAGKGTQSELLCKKLDIPSISTGNILRAAIKDGTPTGVLAKSYMDNGQLVPDEVIIDIVKERLAQPDCQKGFILDGFPRTVPQAEALEEIGVQIDGVIAIEVSEEEILRRMSGRRVCETCGASYHLLTIPPKQEGICDSCGGTLIQRQDDKPETVLARLEIYHNATEPLKAFYAERGQLRTVYSVGDKFAVFAEILSQLGLSE